jgi:hypothetical protein
MNNNIDERDDIEHENMENHNIRNHENDDLGDLRNVRQRVNTTLRPLDDSLSGSPLMTRTEPVSLHALMGTRDQIPRNSRLDLQLLRIISNYNANGSNSTFGSLCVYTRGYRGNNQGNAQNVNYTRLFLCKVIGGQENNAVVYLMESSSKNKRLWGKNVSLRDDGTITVGTILRAMNPLPIEQLMPNGGAILETRFTSIIMKHPRVLPEAPINFGLAGNSSNSFILNRCSLTINSTTPKETNCSGLFCDKQRVRELMDRNQACGCYLMTTTRSNLILDHSINVEHGTWDACIENFSSTQFSRLYQKGTFSSNIRSDSLDLTEEYYCLTDCIEQCIQFVNDNGGFTVTGWYKRGIINDRSIVSNTGNNQTAPNNPDTQVDNGEINFHPCLIAPTNREIMQKNSVLYESLDLLKYDLSGMNLGNANA